MQKQYNSVGWPVGDLLSENIGELGATLPSE